MTEKYKLFKIENNRIERDNKSCPKCGAGVFMAEHKNRRSCGKCGYTEFKKK
jgi:small subunit ribosomal protein S27Ae